MSQYKVPIRDILFSLEHLADLEGVSALPGHEGISIELVQAILEEAGKIAEQILDPLNRIGDQQGVILDNGNVVTPDGWKEAYQTFIDGGWNGLPFNPEYGGQGLPWLIATAVQEIWHSSNMAFSLCTLLTQAAVEAIELHGTDTQKDIFLPNLIAGNWSGTMNLTEPQAGSDLALVKTSARPCGDHYLIQGQKIFITYGDHDLTENIIHLVLARLPDAPEGVKGISLFLVPKFLQGDNGHWTVRNDVETVSLEHKLGIHGSPTAVLGYGTGKYRYPKGAVGYLIGTAHKGMQYMFTMMNIARLAVGLEGNGVSERAYQQAVWFANQRVQGTALNAPGERVTIINHPDVKRMLMLQKSRIEGLRSLGLVLSAAIDKSRKHADAEIREFEQAMIDILTPIVKACMTDLGVENVSLALQVHGGMGFIEETGAAQYYRDQRITPIYEGTNGIQALDLMSRKTLRDNGRIATIVLEHIRQDTSTICTEHFAYFQDNLNNALNVLKSVIQTILAMGYEDINKPAAVCDPYLRLWGTVCCGWQLTKAADIAMKLNHHSDKFYANKIMTAQFYFDYEMPRIALYQSEIVNSADIISSLSADIFDTLQ